MRYLALLTLLVLVGLHIPDPEPLRAVEFEQVDGEVWMYSVFDTPTPTPQLVVVPTPTPTQKVRVKKSVIGYPAPILGYVPPPTSEPFDWGWFCEQFPITNWCVDPESRP